MGINLQTSLAFLPWLFLAVDLLGLHFGAAEAPGEAEADVAAVGGTLANGEIVGVDAAADGAEVKGLNVGMTISPIETMRFQLGGTWQRSLYTGQGKEWDEGQYECRMERTPDIYAYLTGVYIPIKRLQFTATGTFTGPMLVYHYEIAEESPMGGKHGGEGLVHRVITPSFLDLSIKATYSIPFSESTLLEIIVGVKNILDSYQHDLDSGPERDAAYIYGPSLPRTFFFGAKLII